jgi:hypothetical protein
MNAWFALIILTSAYSEYDYLNEIREENTYSAMEIIYTQIKESDNGSHWIPIGTDRILGFGPTFGSLVLESDRILVSEFDGNYRWVLTGL